MFFTEGRNVNDPISIEEFIEKCNVTMTARKADSEKDICLNRKIYGLCIEDERGKRCVELPAMRSKFEGPFSTAEIVNMFLVDAQDAQFESFEDWADNEGYVFRSKKRHEAALKYYARLVDQEKRFSEWLPSDLTTQSIEALPVD